MAAIKKVFVCTECGTQAPKWVGKCPACYAWNTYVEEVVQRPDLTEQRKESWQGNEKPADSKPILFDEVQAGTTYRTPLADPELNRVLGGGLVPGSLILLGGQPGIGKSTLLLQITMSLPDKVLYVSGEESEEQIKMRADRLGLRNAQSYIHTETNVVKVLQAALALKPMLVIIDSIQTMHSPHLEATPGSVSQIRETAAELQRFAKTYNIPVIIIGHITKDGQIAGPKLLEHVVDVVLQFEGDQHYSYRVLRVLKNRFGSTDELGIYEMQAQGMRPVSNPSEMLISQRDDSLSGSAIAATLEGQRPILIETQALVSKSFYGTPQRSTTGFDQRRLHMLLAVLEKRSGLPFGTNDVFLNITGGIRIEDPASDLAVVAAMMSSLLNRPIDPGVCFSAEVGLTGEIRAVPRVEQRIAEAARLGFKYIYVSRYSLKGLSERPAIRVLGIDSVEMLYRDLFT
jgi:DNA repair protein RadA/Sms